MSVDFYFIAPESYTLKTFLKRFPEGTVMYDLGDKRFNIEFNGFRSIWLDEWNYIEDGYQSLEEVLANKTNLNMIYTIHNPRIFSLTSRTYSILYDIVKVIGDDHSILIDSGRIAAPLRHGDEFVAMIRRGEEP